MKEGLLSFKNNGYKLLLFFIYDGIYFPWFFTLEKMHSQNAPFTAISIPLDFSIPFLDFFVIPYILWYAYVFLTVFYFMFRMPSVEFNKMAAFLMSGMIITLFIYTVFPNGQLLRPDTFENEGFCISLVKKIYKKDTPTNVFPSLHCLNSIAVTIAFFSSSRFKKNAIVLTLSFLINLLIILSTVFIKQHSILDIFGAIGLSLVLYILIYRLPFFFKKESRA